MAEIKTKKNSGSVEDFIASINDKQRQSDSERALKMFKEVTGEKPVMWGNSIVGFGSYKYVNAARQENEWMATGFSPRKQALTFYIMPGYDSDQDLLKKLGDHKIGKSCLYIKKLDDIDEKVLRKLIKKGFKQMNGRIIYYKKAAK